VLSGSSRGTGNSASTCTGTSTVLVLVELLGLAGTDWYCTGTGYLVLLELL
jgi:hypothetical protein